MGLKKKCNTCKETKSIKFFYAQKTGGLGRASSCKECRKQYQKIYNQGNKEKRSEYDKIYRKKNPDKLRENDERFRENNPDYWKEYYTQNTEIRLACNKRYLKKNPERAVLYRVYQTALKKGDLVRPDQCTICGSNGQIHGHHFDYSEPLKVTWVCHPCHMDIHRKHKFRKK